MFALNIIIFVLVFLNSSIGDQKIVDGGVEITIVNGRDAKIENNPWQVAINFRIYALLPLIHEFRGGGVIIGNKWVLSSAHLYDEPDKYPVSRLFVRAGTAEGLWWGSKYDFKNVIKHPDYVKASYKNDIAIIELDDTIEFDGSKKPIKMVDKDYVVPSTQMLVHTSGYGSTCFDCVSKLDLKEVDIGTINCTDPSLICAIDPITISSTCQGDSGGPLSFYNSSYYNNQHLLLGIVRAGRDCQVNETATFSSIAYYRDWIYNVTGI